MSTPSLESQILAAIEGFSFTPEEQAMSVKDRYLLFRTHFKGSHLIDFDSDFEGNVNYLMATLDSLHRPFAELLGRLFPDMVIARGSQVACDVGMAANIIDIRYPSDKYAAGSQNNMGYWG